MTRRHSPRTAARTTAALAGAVLLLAACTGEEAGPGGATSGTATPQASGDAQSPTPGPDDVATSFTMAIGGGEVEVDVHPLVRSDEHVVLTYDLRPTAGPGDAGDSLGANVLYDDVTSQRVPGGAVRLVDVPSGRVHLPGVDADGYGVGEPSDLPTVPAEGVRVQRAYAAPEAGTEVLSALFPGALVPDVPVVDGPVPSPALDDDGAEPISLDAVAEAPVTEASRFTRQLDGAVQVIESSEQVQVSLGSDVLFATDSAELTEAAQAALAEAANQLKSHAPGVVDVVGHTDDVGDEASNQSLSERRAASVAGALETLIDTSDYELRQSGRGESEPLVANDSDGNRQLNRRVVLSLTSTATHRAPVETAGETPPFEDGPVATGAEGVVLDGTRQVRITAPEVRRVGDDALLVTIQVEALDDEVDSNFGFGGLSSVFSYRGDGTVYPQNALGVALVTGATAVYPFDYLLSTRDNGVQDWRPLADLDTLQQIDGGKTATFVGLYPAISDADTATVQVGRGLGAQPFRLTDIPVVDGD
ncbi:OmpA family protein [Xylanimonas allomyrinae]|uniref:OmpA family protein n=1 Tax=Xylanimonas allomyrinae TaxID=2509459 RepID=A0A4P6ER67_9MICO|nr:OmpA family protein [Xylanimonas allomyrinae]QAY64383.1 OmpA family protein [Xylanimonas allomyrinae]